MRALIRNYNGILEVIKEPFSPWVEKNINFLTGKEVDANGNLLPGDGWTLVNNYVPPSEDGEATYDIVESVKEDPIQDAPLENVTINEQDGDYIVINGIRYKKV